MKRIIYSLLMGCMVLGACKKDRSSGNDPAGKTARKVAFTVGFSQQTANFHIDATHLTTNSLKVNDVDTVLTNHVSVLIYAVYNSNGTFINQVKQSLGDASFGSYTDTLLPGDYTICVAGGGPNMYIASTTGSTDISKAVLGYRPGYGLYGIYKDDTFFKKITLTVSNADQTKSVALDRITNPVQIVIKDAIPANVKELNFFISGDADGYLLGTETPQYVNNPEYNTYTFNIPVQAGDIGKKNLTVTQMLLYHPTLTVSLYASSTTTNLRTGDLAQKIITGVTCLPNAETILSGNLFGGAGGGGFSLHIDTAYTGTPIIKTFP